VQFGDSQKLRLVRILRSTVMVRVGGGWVALDEFLVKNDPCRGKCHTLINLFRVPICKYSQLKQKTEKPESICYVGKFPRSSLGF
jgi:hypothetical protein